MKNKNIKSGFTLLEILLVVGIISILAGIVIVAINPARQLASVRNAQRKSDIKQINNAILQYYIDEFEYPEGITTSLKEICDTGSLSTTTDTEIVCGDLVDLTPLVPTYITAIPVDPQGPVIAFLDKIINTALAATGGTGYSILKTSTNKIGVQADRAELEQDIVVGMAASSTATTTETGTLGEGLVAHYKMNDTDCTTVEDSAGTNNGSGTCTATESGRIGGALSFDGVSNVISISDSESLKFTDALSVSAWVYTTKSEAANYDGVLSGVYGGVVKFYLGMGGPNGASHNLSAGFYAPGWQVVDSSTNLTANQWVHVIATYDGNYIKIYQDNSLVATSADFASNLPDDSAGWVIGMGWDASYWQGKIDDLRIYNKVLSSDERAELAAGTEAE